MITRLRKLGSEPLRVQVEEQRAQIEELTARVDAYSRAFVLAFAAAGVRVPSDPPPPRDRHGLRLISGPCN